MEESLGYAFDEAGVYELITKEQRRVIAESLATSVENYSMFSGRDCIPNPMDTEVAQLKAAHATEKAKWEGLERVFIRDIARSQNVEPQSVFVKDNRVMISTR